MTETYAVQWEITPGVISDAARLHQATFLARYRALMAGLAIVGLVLSVTVDWALGFTLALTAIILLAMTWAEFLDHWLYRIRGRGVLGGTSRVELGDDGIHYVHPLGSGVMAWSPLTDVRANGQSIVFSRDRVMAAYVPTSAFASPAERDAFLAFARSHVKPAGRPS